MALNKEKSTLETAQLRAKTSVDKVEKELGNSLIGKTISVWGLTFKANTDDMRESPAIAVIERLIGRGASVVAFDPVIKNIENSKIALLAKKTF